MFQLEAPIFLLKRDWSIQWKHVQDEFSRSGCLLREHSSFQSIEVIEKPQVSTLIDAIRSPNEIIFSAD